MKGKTLKEFLKKEGLTVAEVSNALGYDSAQRLHSALKSDDVKSGLIEEIAKVTNRNVCAFYDQPTAIATDNGIAVAGGSPEIHTISEKFINLLQKKDEQMDRLIDVICRKQKDI